MRKLLLLLIGFLSATGVLLVFRDEWPWVAGQERWFSLLHIWGGLFFLVMFPLYAWDHVSTHRHWLRVMAGVTLSGATQLLAASVLILTGLVWLIYGEAAWALLRAVHHGLTYLLLASLAGHFLSPKR
ncbi:MAG: hypothetical protein IID61_04630 [SAR324 cluster bacterium]|nr:hypothetical protein [SAR324 cluster bacterium]